MVLRVADQGNHVQSCDRALTTIILYPLQTWTTIFSMCRFLILPWFTTIVGQCNPLQPKKVIQAWQKRSDNALKIHSWVAVAWDGTVLPSGKWWHDQRTVPLCTVLPTWLPWFATLTVSIVYPLQTCSGMRCESTVEPPYLWVISWSYHDLQLS